MDPRGYMINHNKSKTLQGFERKEWEKNTISKNILSHVDPGTRCLATKSNTRDLEIEIISKTEFIL